MKGKIEFKKIFQDNWGSFKRNHPSYADEHYEITIQKMLGCGDGNNGYYGISMHSMRFRFKANSIHL
jgi:hypothetical protein